MRNLNSTKGEVKRVFILLTILCIVVFTLGAISFIKSYDGIYSSYQDRLYTLDALGLNSTEMQCISISCVSVEVMSLSNPNKSCVYLYNTVTGSLEPTKSPPPPPIVMLNYLNKDFFTAIRYGNKIFYIDDTKYFHNAIGMLLVTMLFFIIIAVLVYFIIFLKSIKARTVEDNKYKRELETIVQRDITEVIHHEMNVPLAVLNMSITKLQRDLFPCSRRNDGVCNMGTYKEGFKECQLYDKENPCYGCPIYYNRYEVEKELIEMFREISLQVDRLNAILKLIGNSRSIKNTNGNISLHTLITNVVNTINSYKISKLFLKCNNLDLLDNFSVSAPLTNGEMLNILHVLFNNSLEAKASEIEVSASKSYKDGFINLTIKDNGGGIRDGEGNIVKNYKIFEYGYTTKIKRSKVQKNIIEHIADWVLSILGYEIEEEYKTGRGIGLYINKTVLNNAGGDIRIKDTSKSGTIFLLTFPIKKTEK